jgi:uncharacterized protein YbjT (DUF2867 family)
MRVLVTGSSGHLGEALLRSLTGLGRQVVDRLRMGEEVRSPLARLVGSKGYSL